MSHQLKEPLSPTEKVIDIDDVYTDNAYVYKDIDDVYTDNVDVYNFSYWRKKFALQKHKNSPIEQFHQIYRYFAFFTSTFL